MRVRYALVSTIVMMNVGCARLNSIHRTEKVDAADGPFIVTVDAKQRHLLIAPEPDAKKSNRYRMCAEAAPDIFSAYASSLGLDVGLGATERSGELAHSIAETAATLERTQTVNLLRESMYRTCERYLSGALNKHDFIIQAARDQRSMVAVLAIEQLTGVVRAKSTIISGPATSASVIDGTEAARLLEQFRAEEATVKAGLANAEKTYAAVRESGKCDTVSEMPAASAKDPTAEEWTACKTTETLVAQRKEDLKATTARLDKALTLATDFVTRTSASTTAGFNETTAGSATSPSDEALMAVAGAIASIASTPGINESLMFCIAYLQRPKKEIFDSMIQACAIIISEQASEDLKKQRSMRVGLVNLSGYQQKVTQSYRLNRFMQRLHQRIDATPVVQLPKKMAAFENRAATRLGLDAACTSHASCKDAVDAVGVHEAFLADETRLKAALQDWDKP